MPIDVIMPALGMDQETGTLVRWIKQPGEAVTRGEPIMEVETDKVVVEIEATGSGVLANVTAFEGDEIPVGQVIAQLLGPGEVPGQAPGDHPAERDEWAEADTNLPPPPAAYRAGVLSSSALASATAPAPTPASLPPASPKARRLAREAGLDLARIRGSGPEGAVRSADLAAAGPPAAVTPPHAARLAPHAASWRVMADRMTASWTAAPHFFLMREVRAAALAEMRARIQPAVEQRSGVRVTYTDILVKLVATALRQHPRLNAGLVGGAVQEHAAINVGIAVATDEALLVPVIREANVRSIGEIAATRTDLVERATAGALTLDDVADGTFTLSNLGMYGVDVFTAIINPPQAAILAVGRIADRVIAVDGQPAVRPTLVLSLSCDHRVVDGARGARFLDEVAALIEEPWRLLA